MADAQIMADRVQNLVDFCSVPGAGHSPNVERPEIVNPAIRAFLDGLD